MNIKQIQEALTNKQVFKTNNVEAFYIDKDYHVKSYDTIIFTDYSGLDLQVYSQTTSKLQKFLYALWYDKDLSKQKRTRAVFTRL